MEALATQIATNPYMQALAILVAIATVFTGAWKALRWGVPVARALVTGGIRRARWKLRRPIVRSASVDCKDIVLFNTRVTSNLISIFVLSLGFLATTGVAFAPISTDIDQKIFGEPFNDSFYVYSKVSFQIISLSFLLMIIFRLGKLSTYNYLVRRYRLRRLVALGRANKSSQTEEPS